MAQIELGLHLGGQTGTGLMDNLGQTEQTDNHGDEGDAGHQVGIVEGEPHGPGSTGNPDRSQYQTKSRADDPLDDGRTGNTAYDGQRKQDQTELLHRADLQSNVGQRGRHKDKQNVAEAVPEYRSDQGCVKSLTGLALLGKRKTVHGGADCGRCSGSVEKYRRD